MDGAGEVIAERGPSTGLVHGGGHPLRITRADPRAMISDELLQLFRRGGGSPEITVDGDVLTINAVNGRWIYRIGEYEARRNAWHMEWPD